MDFSRRETFGLGLGAVALITMPMGAAAATDDVDLIIADFTGGAEMADTGVTLTAPEIAENGNTVPIEVEAEGATAIMLLATGNPTPAAGTFNFGPLAGRHGASTRIRLAKSQDVVAIAKLADGTFARTSAEVKVTIGGCGG